MEKSNNTSKLAHYLEIFKTIAGEDFTVHCDVPSMYYDFRKNKLTLDILHTRNLHKEDIKISTHYLVEFLEVSTLSLHEDYEELDLLYKQSQCLNRFILCPKGEKIEIKAISEKNHDYLKSDSQKMNCNVVIEIEETLILLKAKKIRIDDEEFMLD